jgi:hypothetical protein
MAMKRKFQFLLKLSLHSIMSTTEELLGRKGSGSVLENREYGRRDPSYWSRNTLYLQELVLTSPTSGGRSLGRVRSRTNATEFVCLLRYNIQDECSDLTLCCMQRVTQKLLDREVYRSELMPVHYWHLAMLDSHQPWNEPNSQQKQW